MDRDEVEVHKLEKKERGQYPAILTKKNLVNKGFIIWLLVKFCWRDSAGSPDRQDNTILDDAVSANRNNFVRSYLKALHDALLETFFKMTNI